MRYKRNGERAHPTPRDKTLNKKCTRVPIARIMFRAVAVVMAARRAKTTPVVRDNSAGAPETSPAVDSDRPTNTEPVVVTNNATLSVGDKVSRKNSQPNRVAKIGVVLNNEVAVPTGSRASDSHFKNIEIDPKKPRNDTNRRELRSNDAKRVLFVMAKIAIAATVTWHMPRKKVMKNGEVSKLVVV